MTLQDRWQHFREVPETFPGLVLPASLRNQLFWDGDCGFCAGMVARLQRFAKKPISARPYQEVQAELPPEVLEWCNRQMHWVTPEGSVLGGSLAMSAVLAASGHRFLAAVADSPLCRPGVWLGYRLVAGHRGSLGRAVGAHCEKPQGKPQGKQ